jgi:alkyl hydroperoxide reductase subunit AhpC
LHRANARFEEKGAQVLGLSVDSRSSLKAFATGMGGVSYPLLADFFPHGGVLKSYGLLNEERGTGLRSAVIIDREGIVGWVQVYQPGTLPTPEELLAELAQISGS